MYVWGLALGSYSFEGLRALQFKYCGWKLKLVWIISPSSICICLSHRDLLNAYSKLFAHVFTSIWKADNCLTEGVHFELLSFCNINLYFRELVYVLNLISLQYLALDVSSFGLLVWPHFCYKKSALLLSTYLVVPRLMLYIKLRVNLIVQEFNLVWLNAGTLHISW